MSAFNGENIGSPSKDLVLNTRSHIYIKRGDRFIAIDPIKLEKLLSIDLEKLEKLLAIDLEKLLPNDANQNENETKQ